MGRCASIVATLCNLRRRIACAHAGHVDDDFDGISNGALRRENVLYLVAELEAAIQRGAPLTAEDAAVLSERLIRLASVMRRQASN